MNRHDSTTGTPVLHGVYNQTVATKKTIYRDVSLDTPPHDHAKIKDLLIFFVPRDYGYVSRALPPWACVIYTKYPSLLRDFRPWSVDFPMDTIRHSKVQASSVKDKIGRVKFFSEEDSSCRSQC